MKKKQPFMGKMFDSAIGLGNKLGSGKYGSKAFPSIRKIKKKR